MEKQVSENNYQPSENENRKIICKLSQDQFNKLIKTLNKLSNADYINIRDSQLITQNQGVVIFFDLSTIHQGISLQILNANNAIKLLKSINGDIFIIDDHENSRYIIDNGEIKLFLPKLITEIENDSFPDLNDFTVINQVELDSNQIKKIQNLCKNADHIEYLFDNNNNCRGIYVYEQALYIFPQFVNNTNITDINESNAALSLRSSRFPDLDAEKYILVFLKKNDDYALYIRMNSFTIVHWYESLQDVTGGNVLI